MNGQQRSVRSWADNRRAESIGEQASSKRSPCWSPVSVMLLLSQRPMSTTVCVLLYPPGLHTSYGHTLQYDHTLLFGATSPERAAHSSPDEGCHVSPKATNNKKHPEPVALVLPIQVSARVVPKWWRITQSTPARNTPCGLTLIWVFGHHAHHLQRRKQRAQSIWTVKPLSQWHHLFSGEQSPPPPTPQNQGTDQKKQKQTHP